MEYQFLNRLNHEERHGHRHEHEHHLEHDGGAFLALVFGSIFFIISLVLDICDVNYWIYFAVAIIAYIILGYSVLKETVSCILQGDVFNENFLMSVATIAAICIKQPVEAAGIMLFFRIGEIFEEMSVTKSHKRIIDALDLRPDTVIRVYGEETKIISAKNIETDDIILVRPGDIVPLDGVVVDGESAVDTAPITGEPAPVIVKAGDEIYSGSVNKTDSIKIRVTNTLETSLVSRILHSVEDASENKPQVEKLIRKFSRYYTPAVMLIAIITAIVPSLISGNWSYWIYTAVSFLVISCPCAFIISVPLCYFIGIGRAGEEGILFKGGYAVEALSDIKAVVLDKTGTITKGNFALEKIELFENAYGLDEKKALLLAAAAESHSTHPIGRSIIAAARERALDWPEPDAFKNFAGYGICAMFDESEVIVGSPFLLGKAGVDVSGLSELEGEVYLALNRTLIAKFTIADSIKEDAAEGIAYIQDEGIATAMLTGDAKENAYRIARNVGVDEVYAKMLPDMKLDKFREIRDYYGPSMYVGDGINDAAVLAGADVGAAMGSGADIAIEAADVIFMHSKVTEISRAIHIAKKTRLIAYENIAFAILIKLLVFIFGFIGISNMWFAVFADTGVTVLCVLNALRAGSKSGIML